MFFIGKPDLRARRLCQVTKLCLDSVIAEIGPGMPVEAVGNIVTRVADQYG